MDRIQIKQFIEDHYSNEQIFLVDGHDNAFLGIVDCGGIFKASYSMNQIIENLSQDMSLIEAEEYFMFNIFGAYLGENTPQYIHMIE